jgi:hypothetical protein
MENVGTFFGHLEYITYIRTFWYILEPFGNLAESWYIFRFGILYQEKSGKPCTLCAQWPCCHPLEPKNVGSIDVTRLF